MSKQESVWYQSDPVINDYYSLLESSALSRDFYIEMMNLVQSRPFFFAPYIEICEYLEALGKWDERNSFLKYAISRAHDLFSRTELMASVRSEWSKREALFVVRIVQKYREVFGISMRESILLLSAKSLVSAVMENIQQSPQNLIIQKKVENINQLQLEVVSNEVWWLYDSRRQEQLYIHQDTNAILIKDIKKKSDAHHKVIDDKYEGKNTELAELFPEILKVVENFAMEKQGVLERVALVRLKPKSRVYRHFDVEPQYQGRDRYHIVLASKKGSFMSSGIESRVFQEGDLFYFDNKKMHIAVNDSDDWRIHVIFDIKPLCSVCGENSSKEVVF